MKILRLLLVTGTVNGGDTITLATTASQFSNVGQYPIDVTLGIILTILLFQLMVFNVTRIAVTDGKSKYTGMKILRLLLWLLVLSTAIPSTIP
jgi:archaellum biogenesis protein FlaJ (TadC family)